jgi:hypothetical protein
MEVVKLRHIQILVRECELRMCRSLLKGGLYFVNPCTWITSIHRFSRKFQRVDQDLLGLWL